MFAPGEVAVQGCWWDGWGWHRQQGAGSWGRAPLHLGPPSPTGAASFPLVRLVTRCWTGGGKAEPSRGLVFPSSQQGAREEPGVLNRVWKRLRSPGWEGVAVRMRGAGAGSAAACVAGTHDLAQPSFLPAADSPPAPGGVRGDGGEMRLLLSPGLLEELPPC